VLFGSKPAVPSTETVKPAVSSTEKVKPASSSTEIVQPAASSIEIVKPAASSTEIVKPPPAEAVGKVKVAEHWGRPKWRVSKLKGYGWGAICNYHTNLDNEACCQKSCRDKKFSEGQCRVLMKQWLLAGLELKTDLWEGQRMHLKIDVRKMPDLTEEQVDARMRELTAGLD